MTHPRQRLACLAFLLALLHLFGRVGEDADAASRPAAEPAIVGMALVSPEHPRVGDHLLYRCTVRNETGAPLVQVELSNHFDADCLRFLGAEPPPPPEHVALGHVVWPNLGALDPGGTRIVEVSYLALAPCAPVGNCVGVRALGEFQEHVGQACAEANVGQDVTPLAIPLLLKGFGAPVAPTATVTSSAAPVSPTATPSASPGLSATPSPSPTASPTALAAWTVNTTDDGNDGNCDSGHCSLREAILAANAAAGSGLIRFAIPATDAGRDGQGVCTLRPQTALPDLTADGVTVDGYTQPGAQATEPRQLKIVLDGADQNTMDGLVIQGRGNTVRGLVIQRFAYRNGIVIAASGLGNNRIEGNYIGTDAAGAADRGNCADGYWCAGVAISSDCSDNTVGPGNRIAYNNHGVWINPNGDGNTITQNLIWGNHQYGIRLVNGNADLAAPVIMTLLPNAASGTSCADCTVELFSDSGDQGQFYEGSAHADASGAWTLTLPLALRGPNVTATATDGQGNTSAFSAPAILPR